MKGGGYIPTMESKYSEALLSFVKAEHPIYSSLSPRKQEKLYEEHYVYKVHFWPKAKCPFCLAYSVLRDHRPSTVETVVTVYSSSDDDEGSEDTIPLTPLPATPAPPGAPKKLKRKRPVTVTQ